MSGIEKHTDQIVEFLLVTDIMVSIAARTIGESFRSGREIPRSVLNVTFVVRFPNTVYFHSYCEIFEKYTVRLGILAMQFWRLRFT